MKQYYLFGKRITTASPPPPPTLNAAQQQELNTTEREHHMQIARARPVLTFEQLSRRWPGDLYGPHFEFGYGSVRVSEEGFVCCLGNIYNHIIIMMCFLFAGARVRHIV